MLNNITANDLKVKGISIIDQTISSCNVAIITVNGKSKYVVLSVDEYNHLRECELDAALMKARKDLEEGKFHKKTVNDHIKRLNQYQDTFIS